MSPRFCRRATAFCVATLLITSGCDRSAATDRAPKTAPVGSEGLAEEQPAPPAAPPPPSFERPAPPAIAPESTQPKTEYVRRAEERFERLVPRASLNSWQRFENLVYEANNMEMRGPRAHDGKGPYARSGREIAETWRRYARGVRGFFVLRDSLYSQQDHPYLNEPYAPLLPPNWVTAVAHASTGEEASFEPMALPELDDDAAWRAFETPEALFGELPPSDSLFETATARFEGDEPAGATTRTDNARRTLHILNHDVKAMSAAVEAGPEAVAEVGAERIAASDRTYFGAEIRRRHIIPIFVENPDDHELDEGKGVDIPGREVSEEVLQTVFESIYRRRLADGDLAIERYDLSQPSQRARAIGVLEALIPQSDQTGSDKTSSGDAKIWLWVTGELDPHKKLRGEDARAYVESFRGELEQADVDTSRLELFSKPTVELPRDGLEAAVERELSDFERLDMPMSINLPTSARDLFDVLCCEE